MRSFVDRHRPTQKEEPITDPYEAFGSIAKCSTCEGGFRVAQSKLRDPAIQSLIISTLSNACWLLTDMIAYNSCSLFIEQSTPAIADNLADLLVSPQYSCQVELGYCNREWYTRDFVEAYADRVLATKPESLANDDFI